MNQDFRIAIISDNFPPTPSGGIASASYNLYKMLKDRKFNVRVFTYSEDEILSRDLQSNNDIIRNGASKYEIILERFQSILKRKFGKWFLHHKLFVGLAYQTQIILNSKYGAKKINKELTKFHPNIVFIPDFGVPGYSINKLKNTKYYHVSHHNPIRFLNNPLLIIHSEEDARIAINYEQKSLSKIDKVICPSNYQKKVFEETFTFKNEILVIPNIVDDDYVKNVFKKDIHIYMNLDINYPIVYIPSAASKIKGEQYVIEIIRRISAELNNQVGFYLSGGLSDNQRFELKILEKYHVFAPGMVNNETNISYIKDCRICVSPTLLESFGMALLEALFCQLPCVTFNVGGNQDIIVNGENGYLVPFLDMEDLIEKSVMILKNNQFRNELMRNIQRLNKKFSSKVVFEKYILLFESKE